MLSDEKKDLLRIKGPELMGKIKPTQELWNFMKLYGAVTDLDALVMKVCVLHLLPFLRKLEFLFMRLSYATLSVFCL